MEGKLGESSTLALVIARAHAPPPAFFGASSSLSLSVFLVVVAWLRGMAEENVVRERRRRRRRDIPRCEHIIAATSTTTAGWSRKF